MKYFTNAIMKYIKNAPMRNFIVFLLPALWISACQTPEVEWISTTADQLWASQNESGILDNGEQTEVGELVLEVNLDRKQQTIEGFGSCFNELGWTSLNKLPESEREAIMEELFEPGTGANFTICRMPVAANDFSLKWYSYDETPGDFAMEHFSIDNDKRTLIPFIKNALRYNPDLKIWASPWSPPAWMKHNMHYASRSSARMAAVLEQRATAMRERGEGNDNPGMMERFRIMMDPNYQNDLPPDREGHEGTNMFIMQEPYLEAYALYFTRFIQAYRQEGIDVFAVMPQNEFNSAQIFPSCCWTAAGLDEFIGNYLGPAMEELGVEVYFGTMERPTEELVDTILQDPLAGKYIKGVGFQWAGKDALPGIHARYPDLELWQTEQECGDGQNDWKGAMYSWNLMKQYLNNGVSVYEYWNTSLLKGGISRWGWAQNSLVVVDEIPGEYAYTYEYYMMKHASHFVLPGAKKLATKGYADALAFQNTDHSVIVILANQTDEAMKVKIRIGDHVLTPTLEANSMNTIKFTA